MLSHLTKYERKASRTWRMPASETELEDCLDVETDPVPIDLTDVDTGINDQDLKEIADTENLQLMPDMIF